MTRRALIMGARPEAAIGWFEDCLAPQATTPRGVRLARESRPIEEVEHCGDPPHMEVRGRSGERARACPVRPGRVLRWTALICGELEIDRYAHSCRSGRRRSTPASNREMKCRVSQGLLCTRASGLTSDILQLSTSGAKTKCRRHLPNLRALHPQYCPTNSNPFRANLATPPLPVYL